MALSWDSLLRGERVRDLFKGSATQRSPEEHRSEFDRDYGRAIFSTPVRRLQDKAQVFPLEPNDAVRTRLTHSLEVSTLARNISDAVSRKLYETREISLEQAGSIPAIAATCGLLHDLGNPPFGHAGEQAIADWFDKMVRIDAEFRGEFHAMSHEGKASQFVQDFLRFDGNPQTLRLVSKLQLVSDLHGMNLTCGTLSAACKYVASSDKVTKEHINSKTGLLCIGKSIDPSSARHYRNAYLA